ncbi:hypothetical protein PanWU01x14_074830 [Parasponia andersonii]|uniref:Uncharacterized protein n=1 Tax=Parasponia andersonii TaxID=3476 RepID=A0A2P5DDH0_PARAD|nr:hypothetical protein PanWU01x14_074830 [Parasponia andersonii]
MTEHERCNNGDDDVEVRRLKPCEKGALSINKKAASQKEESIIDEKRSPVLQGLLSSSRSPSLLIVLFFSGVALISIQQ